MQDREIKIAVIGAGGRSRGIVSNLLRDSRNFVKVASVYDPDKAVAKLSMDTWHSDGKICDSYEEAIATPGVEWVIVASPNAFHKEHILAGFAAGKHVFSEKPMATSIEDCETIFAAHAKTNLQFATGFVLRYAPIYRKAKELLTSGKLGKLLSVNANENIMPYHGAYIMCNWRRLTSIAGPHILEKCCHDLDLLNWLCDSLPSKVASFASRDFFIPENAYMEEKYDKKIFHVWDDPHKEPSPFTSDKDLMDNQVAIMSYRNGVKGMFQCTMANAIPERRMLFNCSEGTMKLDLYTSTLEYKVLGSDELISFNFGADGHGGGDDYIMKELYEAMLSGEPPKCSGREGLESAVVALAIDQAARDGEIVDLEPIWKNLNR